MDMEKVYEPQKFESDIYAQWLEKGYFTPEINRDKKPFTIVIPPPNITGQLHMGHALDNAVQDCLIRYKRMQGYCALWLPGTDHASIATELKIVEQLKKDGLDKQDVGRERFLELAWEWKEKYGGRIVEQLKRLGSSCDWSREAFTLDEKRSRAVRHVFKKLYDKGLIYQGDRITNWCPECGTALSDAEVDYCEHSSHLWHFKYFTDDGRSITFATTRPETMLGDTAVAVNPDDGRYADFVGHTVKVPFVNRTIPIIADSYVEKDFGTGVVKITPAHDPNDFEVGVRHGLPVVKVLTDDAHMTQDCGKYAGMDRYEARKAIVADLEAGGYLASIEPHKHNVGTCYRCGTTVEPMVSKQWFVKMAPLAKEAIRVVEDGEVKFVPDRFSKTYTNWMENVHDWCISRQLWWGHQIPAWYCDECGHINVSREDPTKCEKCGCTKLTRDEDVLDTWFSSGLWPFSTLGWPDLNSEDLKYWYPTTDMVTGYDIIFFWVARMVVSGMEQMKKEPFKTVFIHGLVRDDKGRKMSKSLGNGIDPLEMAEKYGADALRFNLITGNSPGNDMRFYVEKCEAMRNFANKIWNASRYVLMNLTVEENGLPDAADLEIEDKWVLSKLNTLIKEVTENMDAYELGVASAKVYDFIWDTYCDWYIELTKARLYGEDEKSKLAAQKVLVYVLDQFLRLLHPFMPFITEEIWQAIPHEGRFLMLADWPKYDENLNFSVEAAHMESVMNAIRSIRNRRAEMNVPPSKKSTLYVVSDKGEIFRQGTGFICRLAYADQVIICDSDPEGHENMVCVVTNDAKLYIPLEELIDFEKELARIEKEKANCLKQIAMFEGKLSNEAFVSRAPEKVVAEQREKLEKNRALLAQLEESEKRLRR